MKLNFQKTENIYQPPVELLKYSGLSEYVKNFYIPDDNSDEITLFIESNGLEEVIYKLPSMLADEFPEDKLSLKLSKTEDITLVLEVLTSFNSQISNKKIK